MVYGLPTPPLTETQIRRRSHSLCVAGGRRGRLVISLRLATCCAAGCSRLLLRQLPLLLLRHATLLPTLLTRTLGLLRRLLLRGCPRLGLLALLLGVRRALFPLLRKEV